LREVELLLQRTPQISRAPSRESDHAPREDLIRSRADLSQAERFVDFIGLLGLLFDQLRADPQQLTDSLWAGAQIGRLDDVTLPAMIWTAAARYLWAGVWEVEPIPVKLWQAGLARVEPGALIAAVRDWMRQILPQEAQFVVVDGFFSVLFDRYEAELLSFPGPEPPDPKYMEFFLFTDR
jgi:hypothetical protein